MYYKETPQNGNVYLHMWDVSTVKVYDGGFLLDKSNLPEGLRTLPKGTFLKVDLNNRTAKAVKTFLLFEAITSASTEVKVVKNSLLKKGDIIGTGNKKVTVSDIDTSNAEYDKFVITAGDLGALTSGATLQAFESGKLLNPDGFNYNDKPIEDETTVSVIYAVDGVVAERLPSPVTNEIVTALKHCQILIKQ